MKDTLVSVILHHNKSILMLKEIKNIIFDLGGVLANLDSERCIQAFDAIGCTAISSYVRQHRTEDLFYDIEIGHSTTADFCNEVRRICHSSATDGEIIGAWNALITDIPDERKALLMNLQGDYRIFLLSNTNDMHWRLCADHLFNYNQYRVSDMFECVYLSYRLHLAKPDKTIFTHVLVDAGLQPGETLFIDDNADNCRAAEELGIHTLLNKANNYWTQCL